MINVLLFQNEVVIKIMDERQRIPAEKLAKIFNPFQTASVIGTSNEKSTGPGLAIIKKIIEAHKGTVSVESEVGKGSVFTFKIPMST